MHAPDVADHRLPLTAGQRALLRVGSLGPFGHFPASGAVTVAAVGVPAVWLAAHWGVPLWAHLAAAVVLATAGVWIHDVGDRLLGEKDSRKLVIDELVGYAIAMIAVPVTWQILVVSFFLERAIDMLKIWPANRIEQQWPGGWGVVGDDVMAGLYTLGILHGLVAVVPGWLGLGA